MAEGYIPGVGGVSYKPGTFGETPKGILGGKLGSAMARSSSARARQKAIAKSKLRIAREAEARRIAEELARKKAEQQRLQQRLLLEQQQKATQQKITAGTIGGQVSLPSKKVSPAKYVYQTLVTSGLPIKVKLKRVFDPSAYIKSPYEKEREYEREAKVQADVLEFGKPEYFGGASLSKLLPYQTRGTAEITTKPFTEKEIARTKYYKGAPIILGRRAQKEAEIISFGAEQEAKVVVGKYQKEVDVLGVGIQKEIRGGLPYEEGVAKYERETKKLQEEAQKEYEKTYSDITSPQLEKLESKYEKLYKKQQRTAIGMQILEQSPLLAGTLLVSAALPPVAVAKAATIGGLIGLSQLGKDKGGKYYETTVDIKRTPTGEILGYGISDKMTSAGTLKLLGSSVLLVGGGYGLYKTHVRGMDIKTLKGLEKQRATILGREVSKTTRGTGLDVFATKGYKYDIKTGVLKPVGEAQQISRVRYALIKTGEKKFSIPSIKGEVATKYWSYEKGKLIVAREPIQAVARGQISKDIFAVSKQGDLLLKTKLKGWQTGYGRGVLIKGEKLQRFDFLGLSKKTKGYLQVKAFQPEKLRVNIRLASEDYGKVSLISRRMTGKGLIKLYKKPKDVFEVLKIPKDVTVISDTGKTSFVRFQPPPVTARVPLQQQIIKQVPTFDLQSVGVSATESILQKTIPVIQQRGVVATILPPITKMKAIPKQVLVQQPKQEVILRTKQLPSQVSAGAERQLARTRALQLSPTATRFLQSQSPILATAQVSRLRQAQIQRLKLQQTFIAPPTLSILPQYGFGYGGLPIFPPFRLPFGFGGKQKRKTQIRKQRTAYQPSFTGSLLQIKIKVPKDYERYGYGALRLRGIPIYRKK